MCFCSMIGQSYLDKTVVTLRASPIEEGGARKSPNILWTSYMEAPRERFEVGEAERSYLFVDEAVSYARTHALAQAHHMPHCQASKGVLWVWEFV